jgi:hypothetical protein
MRAHVAMLRAASVERRAAIALALSDDVVAMSRRALAGLHPGLSEREVAEL